MYSYINIDVYVFALLFTVLYLNFLEKKKFFISLRDYSLLGAITRLLSGVNLALSTSVDSA
jgi:hypothetical protein